MKYSPQYSNLLQFDMLGKYASLFHFSTTCNGGLSEGSYSSFNLGEYSGDIPENICKNRQHLAAILGISSDNLLLPCQTHEDKVLIVDSDFMSLPKILQNEQMKGVDAMITNQKNVCIGVTTADCVPLLIFDPVKNVLATIHAGWRGTVAKIVTKTIEQMVKAYTCNPNDLKVGIAPAISQNCFEVGDEVVTEFSDIGFLMDDISYRHPETGKIHIDLCRANALLLTASGILSTNIEFSGMCTYSNPELFFSARRQTIKSGRMVTGGILK